MKRIYAVAALTLLLCTAIHAQKMNPEDILAKNLESIGSNEVRYGLKNITAIGQVTFTQGTIDQGGTLGKGVVVSEGSNFAMAMAFPIPVYPMEKITSSGHSIDVAFTRPGVRSALGEYLLAYREIVSEGLFAGTLGREWAPYFIGDRKPKLSGGDLKKVSGKDAYVVSYSPRKGSDLSIHLYFDKETFRHIRTEYVHTVSAQMGATADLSASQSESRENLTEDFSDFQTDKGVTLPRTYELTLYKETGKTSRKYFYNFKFDQLYYNQPLDPATFGNGPAR